MFHCRPAFLIELGCSLLDTLGLFGLTCNECVFSYTKRRVTPSGPLVQLPIVQAAAVVAVISVAVAVAAGQWQVAFGRHEALVLREVQRGSGCDHGCGSGWGRVTETTTATTTAAATATAATTATATAAIVF